MEFDDINTESADFFQFKERQGRELRLPMQAGNPPNLRRGKLFLVNNQFGFVAAGTEQGFLFVPTAQLHRGGDMDPSTASVVGLSGPVKYLTVSGDGQYLAAIEGEEVHVYHTPSLYHKKPGGVLPKHIKMGAEIIMAEFSKASKGLLAVVLKGKGVFFHDLTSGEQLQTIPGIYASWHPSADELAVLLPGGEVNTYSVKDKNVTKLNTVPEISNWDEPPLEALFLDWFDNTNISVGYRTDMGGTLVLIDLETNKALKSPIEIQDEWSQYYSSYLTDWGLYLVTTTTQGTVEVFGKVNGVWNNLTLEEETRAVFPVKPTGGLTKVVGIDIDVTCVDEKPVLDPKSDKRYPPTALVAFLTDIGRINTYSAIHLRKEGYSRVKSPTPVPMPPAAATSPALAQNPVVVPKTAAAPLTGASALPGFTGFGNFSTSPGGMFAAPPAQPKLTSAATTAPAAKDATGPLPTTGAGAPKAAGGMFGPIEFPSITGAKTTGISPPTQSETIATAPAKPKAPSSLPPDSSLFDLSKPVNLANLGAATTTTPGSTTGQTQPPAAATKAPAQAPKSSMPPESALFDIAKPPADLGTSPALPSQPTGPAPGPAKAPTSSMPPDSALFDIAKPPTTPVPSQTTGRAPGPAKVSTSTTPAAQPAAQTPSTAQTPAQSQPKTSTLGTTAAAPPAQPKTGAAPAAAKQITSPTSQETLHAQFSEALHKFKSEVVQIKTLVQQSNAEVEGIDSDSSRFLRASDVDSMLARTTALFKSAEELGSTYKEQYKAMPTLNIALVNCWSVTESIKQYLIAKDDPEYLFVLANRPLPREAEEMRKKIFATKDAIDLQITSMEELLEKLLLDVRHRKASASSPTGQPRPKPMTEPPSRMLPRAVVNIMTGITTYRALVDSLIEQLEKLKVDTGFQPTRRYAGRAAAAGGKNAGPPGRGTPGKVNLTTPPPLRLPISNQNEKRARPSRSRLRELKALVQRRSATNKFVFTPDLDLLEEEPRPFFKPSTGQSIQSPTSTPTKVRPTSTTSMASGSSAAPLAGQAKGPALTPVSSTSPFSLGTTSLYAPKTTSAEPTTKFMSFAPAFSATPTLYPAPPTASTGATKAAKTTKSSTSTTTAPAPGQTANKFQQELDDAYKRESGLPPGAAKGAAAAPLATTNAALAKTSVPGTKTRADFDDSDEELNVKPPAIISSTTQTSSTAPAAAKTSTAAPPPSGTRKSPVKPPAPGGYTRQGSGSVGGKPSPLARHSSRGSSSSMFQSQRSDFSDDDGSFDQLDEEDEEYDDLSSEEEAYSGDGSNDSVSPTKPPARSGTSSIRRTMGKPSPPSSGNIKLPAPVVSTAPAPAPAKLSTLSTSTNLLQTQSSVVTLAPLLPPVNKPETQAPLNASHGAAKTPALSGAFLQFQQSMAAASAATPLSDVTKVVDVTNLIATKVPGGPIVAGPVATAFPSATLPSQPVTSSTTPPSTLPFGTGAATGQLRPAGGSNLQTSSSAFPPTKPLEAALSAPGPKPLQTTEQKIASTARTLDFTGATAATAATAPTGTAPAGPIPAASRTNLPPAGPDQEPPFEMSSEEELPLTEEDEELDYDRDGYDDSDRGPYGEGNSEEDGEVTEALSSLQAAPQPVAQAPIRQLPASLKQSVEQPKLPAATPFAGDPAGGSANWFSAQSSFSISGGFGGAQGGAGPSSAPPTSSRITLGLPPPDWSRTQLPSTPLTTNQLGSMPIGGGASNLFANPPTPFTIASPPAIPKAAPGAAFPQVSGAVHNAFSSPPPAAVPNRLQPQAAFSLTAPKFGEPGFAGFDNFENRRNKVLETMVATGAAVQMPPPSAPLDRPSPFGTLAGSASQLPAFGRSPFGPPPAQQGGSMWTQPTR